MFRTKKNSNAHENNPFKKKSNNLNSNESSTDEGSNQKANIYQLSKRASPNIIILNNKILSANIPPINHTGKRNFDFKKDNLIKEIIGNENILTENNNRFRSLYNLDDNNNLEMELIEDTIKKSIIPNSNSSLMSKNSIKGKFSCKKEKTDEYKKGNNTKTFKRKHSLNINKLKIYNYDSNHNFYNTPKSHRSKIITLNSNEKSKNDSLYNYAMNNNYKNSSKSQIKYNEYFDKKGSISKLIFKNNSNLTKQELKEKKIKKIIQLMNNNNPSLNVNILRKGKKDNYISILSNLSNRNKKIFTLQNNLNFNDIIYTHNKRHKKKLIFKINKVKKEKTDYYDQNDIYFINIKNNEDNEYSYINTLKTKCKDSKARNSTRDNFYRKNKYFFNELNISTDYTSRENKYKTKSENKKKEKYKHLDSSNEFINSDIKNNTFYEKMNMNNESKKKINWNNYKILLNDVQKRMSLLINNLFNYIELLKKDK